MSADPPPGDRRFATTRWSRVAAAARESRPDEGAALAELCAAYWYPLYAYERRRGTSAHDAADFVQGFFAELLAKGWLAAADRERGRFRTFLLTAFRHHVGRVRERAAAQKRGGGHTVLSLDIEDGESRYHREPADTQTPERLYERRFALTVLDRVVGRVREELASRGKAPLFDALVPYVVGGSPLPSYRAIGETLGMTEGAVKVTVHRLRVRYRELLREEIADTLSDPAQVDDEIRALMNAL